MEVLFPRTRGKSQQGTSQSVPSLRSSIVSDPSEKSSDIPSNEQPESESHIQATKGGTTFTRQSGNKTYTQARLPNDWSDLEPDERGAELAREARFWKVYVEETDKWDKERVEGWDKSMDVLLVFAALFSAISGAFLIETSKLLKEDPADVSAAALRAISHVLVNTTASGSTGGPPSPPPAEGSFTPPKIAVIVNTLWYMSLSLSIATAFLAMLAKDWCYSFLAHRTGHPRDQSHRRQRRWKLIERWKMEELIIVLPSLMHISLLLFAIGLCIYLWDLNRTIAIPVMCIAGAFLGFYIWSSIAASIVEDFPYTTIISRIIRSKFIQALKDVLIILGWLIAAIPLLIVLGGFFIYFCLVMVILLVIMLLPFPPLFLLSLLLFVLDYEEQGDRIFDAYLASWDPTFNLGGAIIFGPPHMLSRVYYRVRDAIRTLELSDDTITSLALGWMIQHCETPRAVDIALQAIAGASRGVPKEPILASGATEQIMRYIVASDSSDEGSSRKDLYIQGLEFLGLNSRSNLGHKKLGIAEEIKVMVWDLKSKNERDITDLVKDGNFLPSDHNLEAMSIGNSAASQSLSALMGEDKSTTQSLCSITQLLAHHHKSNDKRLHPAALRSLANAAALHLALSTSPKIPPDLPDLFMQYCGQLARESTESAPPFHAGAIFIMCVLFYGHRSGGKPPDATKSVHQLQTHARRAIRALIDISVESRGVHKGIFWIGCSEILADPSKYGLDPGSDSLKPLQDWCSKRASKFSRKRGKPFISWWDNGTSVHSARNRILAGIRSVYELVEISRSSDIVPTLLPESIHTILTVIACGNSLDERQSRTCNELLSKFSFPKLNDAFVASLEMHIDDNDKTMLSALGATYIKRAQAQQRRHFAATQLWLLLHLTTGSSSDAQKRLKNNIERELEDSLQCQKKGFDQVQQNLEVYIIENYRTAHRTSDKKMGDGGQSPSVWDKIKSSYLKWRTRNNTQGLPLSSGGWARVKSALGLDAEDSCLTEKHQRVFTARIIQLIIQTNKSPDHEDLVSFIEDDLRELPLCLRDLSSTPVPSRHSSEAPEAESTDIHHVTLNISGQPGALDWGDRDADSGIATLSNDSSEALLSKVV